MPKKTGLFFLIVTVSFSIHAFDIGVRIERGDSLISASPDTFGGDISSAYIDLDFGSGAWRLSPFVGIGAFPVSSYAADGSKVFDAHLLIPVVGIRGGYAVPIGASPFQLPIGVSFRAAFPSAQKIVDLSTAANAAITVDFGFRFALDRYAFSIGMNGELLSVDSAGVFSTIADRKQVGFFFGASVPL